MRSIRSLAAAAALMLLAMSLGCGSDDGNGKKETANSTAAPKPSQQAAANGSKNGGENEMTGSHPAAPNPTGAAAIDTSYILPGQFAAIVFKPRRIAESPLVAEQLKQENVAAAIKDFGIAPEDVDLLIATFRVDESSPNRPKPMLTAIAHFNRDVEAKEVATRWLNAREGSNSARATETDIDGKKCYRFGRGDGLIYAPDPRTIIISDPIGLKEIIAGKAGKSPLAERLAKADADNDIIAVATPGSAAALPALMDDVAPHDEPPVKAAFDAVKGIEAATAYVNLKTSPLVSLSVDAKDAKAATAIRDLLKDYVKQAVGGLAYAKQSMPPAMQKAFAPGLKLADDTLDSIEIAASGNHVTATIERPADLEQVAGPQIERFEKTVLMPARAAAASAIQMNNLKQVGIALGSYESAQRSFPAQAILKNGKPLLSWRVAILPFIEEDALYKQFHLDEPWNSPNNIKLLDKMPPTYQTPGSSGGKTSVEVFTGKGTIFDGDKAVGRDDIRDGMSQTILAVEAGPDKAVPWTKPEDLPFDPKDPAAALGDVPAAGFLAAFCDGSVRTLPKSIDAATLKALITPNGNERIDMDKLERGK